MYVLFAILDSSHSHRLYIIRRMITEKTSSTASLWTRGVCQLIIHTDTRPKHLVCGSEACRIVYSAPRLSLTAAVSSYPGQYWSVSVYIESWGVSSTCSQSGITHNHAFCGDTLECTQFSMLSAARFSEPGAAKVGVLFVCLVECPFPLSYHV